MGPWMATMAELRVSSSISTLPPTMGDLVGEPGEEFFAVGGVADHEPVFFVAGDDDVVEDAAGGVADQGVHGLAGDAFGDVAGADFLEEGFGVFAGEFEAAHVGDIEDGGRGCGCVRVRR